MVRKPSATGVRMRRLVHELKVKLGGVCKRCGFADERALEFDHIIGGIGRNRPTGWARFKGLTEDAELGKIQLLCANCNRIKRHEVGSREQGGKTTWTEWPERDQRRLMVLQKLRNAKFRVPTFAREMKRNTSNNIAPLAQQIIKIAGFPMRAIEVSEALHAMGWKFGKGRKEYDMGSMICRTAMRRRPDIFSFADNCFDARPEARDLRSEEIHCLQCGYQWIPKIPGLPRVCALCGRNWRTAKLSPHPSAGRCNCGIPLSKLIGRKHTCGPILTPGLACGDYIKL